MSHYENSDEEKSTHTQVHLIAFFQEKILTVRKWFLPQTILDHLHREKNDMAHSYRRLMFH